MPPVNPETVKAASSTGKTAGKAGSTAQKGANSAKKGNANLPEINRQSGVTDAQNYLRNSENSAENNENGNTENVENSENVNYTGSGRSTGSNSGSRFSFKGKEKGKVDVKNLAKKGGPLILVLGVFLLPVLLIIGTGSLLFADIDENTMESMDVQYVAMRAVAKKAVGMALENGSLPSPLADRLTESGLEVGYLDDSGTFIAGLRPNSDTKVAETTTSDSAVLDNAVSLVGESSSSLDNSLVLRFKDIIITSANWDEYFENPEVYSAFNDATYGRAAGHYDSAAEVFYSNINASRNVFANYTSSDTTDFREILNNYYNNQSDSNYTVDDRDCEKRGGTDWSNCDSSKSGKSEAVEAYLENLYNNTLIDPDNCDWNWSDLCGITEKIGLYNGKQGTYDKAQAATIAYLVNSAVNANETYESMKYFLTLEEVMSKTKAGDGASAPINEMLNYLTTADETGISAVQSPTLSSVLTKSFEGYNSEKETTPFSLDRIQEITKKYMTDITEPYLQTALATTGITWSNSSSSSYAVKDDSLSIIKLLGEESEPQEKPIENCNIEDEDYDICHANFEDDHKKWEQEVKEYIDDYLLKSCNPIKQTPEMEKYGVSVEECRSHHETTASLIEKLIEVLSPSDSSHSETSLKKSESFLANNAYATENNLDSKTTFLSEDGFKTVIGAHSGELFSKGGSILGAKIATTAQGGTVGTEESVVAYKKNTDYVLALDAAADRHNRSPFDITSQNTFLGNIVHSFSNYFYTTPSLSSSFSSFSSLLRNSFVSLLPGAFADSESSFQTTYGDCPESALQGEKFVCSAFSFPTVTFDVETILSIIDSTDFSDFLKDNLDDNHQPKEKSILEEFISNNNNRTSNAGYINTAIADKIEQNNPNFLTRSARQFGEFIKNKVTQFDSEEARIEDYFSTYYSRFNDEELAKISGNAYINNSGTSWKTDYSKAQLYCVLARFLEQAGYFSLENTNKTAFNDYFAPGTGENPYIIALKETSTDFSTLNDAEYLAAISGMSENEANIVLGYFAYESYLASIDYENRLAFGKEETFDFENSIQFENDDIIETELAILAKNDHLKIARKDPTHAA